MRQMVRWFVLSLKRLLKRPIFAAALLFLPLVCIWFGQMENRPDDGISIALFTDSDPWNEKVAETLAAGSHSFSFYVCETKQQLQDDVAAGRAECGYSFPAGLRDMLETGAAGRKIRVTVSPSTAAAELAEETVFAGLFEVYGKELLLEYAAGGAAFEEAAALASGEEIRRRVGELYEQFRQDGSTFSFVYEYADGGPGQEPGGPVLFPVRGTAAVFLFIMALAAAVLAARDAERGFYGAAAPGKKCLFQTAGISAAVCLAAGSVLISLLVSGRFAGWRQELIPLLFYSMLCTAAAQLMLSLLKRAELIAAVIPFFILGSLIVCPVFADLSPFVPAVRGLRYLFLPWYYLRM